VSNPLISLRSGHITARTDMQTGVAVSRVAAKVIDRYAEMVRREMPALSAAEATILVRSLNGRSFNDAEGLHRFWAEVEDEDLASRLKALSYAECVAVIDAVERFWLGPYRQEGPIEARLREVGLVK
jgi:hypothetical protein